MTFQPKSEHERILHRLKITRGHLNKVISMVENHEQCIAVVHQSNAVQKALRQLDNVIIENHLRTCVAQVINAGNANEIISEILDSLKMK